MPGCYWRTISASLFSALLSLPLFADAAEVEHILVEGQTLGQSWTVDAAQLTPAPDVARWLKALPGADVNSNGPVSGIAQYRGLYGDRVNVSVGGHPVIGAGPNAMDAPLSYAPTINTERLTLFRGVAPVSAGLDTLGGAFSADLYQPDFASSANPQFSGELRTGYQDNGDASDLAGRLHLADSDHAAILYAEDLFGRDDLEDGDGRRIHPSRYHKRSAGLDYRHRLARGQLGGSYHYLDTTDAGTPALPMDIDYIRTHRLGLVGDYGLGFADLQWQFGYSDADHVMDNYRLRHNNHPQQYRKTKASSDSYDWRLSLLHDLPGDAAEFNQLMLGIDGVVASHDALISNPNSAMFRVDNFHNVDDRRFGLFAEWRLVQPAWDLQLGGRLKYVDADAGNVSHSMAMLNANIAELVQRFNQADKQVNDTLLDLALNSGYQFAPSWRVLFGVAMKQRAASYQERYLWLPMQSTGGLADGKTYVGEIDLHPETAWQVDMGVEFQRAGVTVSPRLFYQRIDDYIQGTPSTDPVVRQVAAAMGDDSPLQFSNLDAELYGADVSWFGQLNGSWTLGGQASYTRGKRRDINDNLYRIAPPNMSLYVEYALAAWQAQLNWSGYARQEDVARTNQEQVTAGYAVFGAQLVYLWGSDGRLRGGVSNLFNRSYQDHLAGYNRVSDSEIGLAERLPGTGRTLWFEAQYLF